MKSYQVKCPITKVAQILSDTWTMLIMHQLIDGPRRFCELEDLLPGISTRTLTLKLKRLVAEGMVIKTKEGYYEASRKGQGIKIIEKAMTRYEQEYL
jgi:DNA-binding HxlR family transcriptional regulator